MSSLCELATMADGIPYASGGLLEEKGANPFKW